MSHPYPLRYSIPAVLLLLGLLLVGVATFDDLRSTGPRIEAQTRDLAGQKRALFADTLRRAGLMGATALILCLLAWFYFTRNLTNRAARLVASTREMAAGKLPEPAAALRGSDEFAQLDASFRRMAGDIHLRTAELGRSEERLALILRGSGQGTWDWNIETGELTWDEAAAAMLGRAVSEFWPGSRGWHTLIHPDDLQATLAMLRTHMDGRTPIYEAEFRMRHKNGGWVWVLDTGRVVQHDAAGHPLRMAGTHRDITERKRHEEEIARLAAFPQMNPNPVFALTAEGAIRYENVAAQALVRELGFAQAGEILPPGTAEIVRECLAAGKSRQRLETPCDGHILSWSFHPIPDRGVVHCYAADVTERHQLEEQLRQVQKMESIGQLAAGIAHDFSNVLTVIQGYTDLLLPEIADRPRSGEAVKEIAAAAERAVNLTRQLLLFSRKQVAQRRPLDLNELAGNLTKMLGRILGEDIALRLECAPDLPVISADPGMIEQVITNLCVNARDAMPGGGRLEIATASVQLDAARVLRNPEAQPGRFIRLTVADSGTGIAPELVAHIFEPFFTTKEPGKGTGLGLATVYGIVMQHGGVIEVTSQPGKGTRFHIFLPAASRAGDAGAELAPVAAPAAGGSETILLCEDEPQVLSLVETFLRKAGYTVLPAPAAIAVEPLWREHGGEIDLLLTDLVMPGALTGKQLAESLKAQKPGLRVLFMSGYSPELRSGEPDSEEGRNFIQKPFAASALLEAVRLQLDSCR